MATKVLAVIQGTEGDYVPLVTQDGKAIPSIVRDASNLIEASGPTFVFRPGGVAAGNVYTTWPTLMTAVNGIAGDKWVAIDASLATATVPAGAWNVDGVTFTGVGAADNLSGSGGVLNFANGATLTGTFRMFGLVTFISQSSAPVYVIDDHLLIMNDAATIQSAAGAAPFLAQVGANSGLIELGTNAGLGDSTHAALTVAAGQSVLVNMTSQGSILAHALAGLGTAQLFLSSDAFLDPTQGITTQTITLQSLANQDLFNPATPGNWNPQPTIVGGNAHITNAQGALDQIVSPNFHQAISAAPNAAFASFALGANLTRLRGGLFRVTGWLAGTDSTTEVVTVTLVRDGTTVVGPTGKLPAPPVGGGGVPAFGGSFTWTDHIADALPHTWTIQAVGTSGGTLAVPTGDVGIEVVEQ